MPDSPTPEPESTFVCDCEEWMRSACGGEPFYKEHEAKRYCVLHFPGQEKSADFEKALQRKLENKDFDFRGVWFPDEVSFTGFDFSADASFRDATFSASVDFGKATFRGKADFGGSTFRAAAYFGSATFRAKAEFGSATFRAKAEFGRVTFSDDAYFNSATFSSTADFRSATFGSTADFRSATFGAAADFTSATFSSTVDFFSATFRAEADFRSATFNSTADFRSATFSSTVDFFSATFRAEADFAAATFSAEADFTSATFSAEANFRDATFSAEADFTSATFSAEANFRDATFGAEADFTSATFGAAADFSYADFSSAAAFAAATFSGDAEFRCTLSGKTDFSFVTFKDYVKFARSKSTPVFSGTQSLDLQFARIEKPDHLSFHTLSLRPHWFVNVDARKFEFINVKWHVNTAQEIKDLKSGYPYSAVYQLLAIAFRQLAVNAEDNHRYEEASRFRYMAMDVRRREHWRGLAFWRLSWWYWLASGYGERVLQAFLVLLGIWFVAALLYTQVGFARWEPKLTNESDVVIAKRDDIGAPLKFSRALTYSAGVLTFQRPEPRPATTAAQTVVLFETILGPVQAALLALAIRRKFMR